MRRQGNRVQPRNVSMYGKQWATVQAYAKDQGYSSTSAALRRIVDEWVELKDEKRRNGNNEAAA